MRELSEIERFHSHLCRRSFATEWREAGSSLAACREASVRNWTKKTGPRSLRLKLSWCAARESEIFNLLIKRQLPPPARSDCRATHSEDRQIVAWTGKGDKRVQKGTRRSVKRDHLSRCAAEPIPGRACAGFGFS